MKLSIIILISILSTNVFAVDKEKAKQTSAKLAEYLARSVSTTPDKAFSYISDRDDQDADEVAETTIDSNDVSDGKIIITRSTKLATGTKITLTKCDVDFGTADMPNNNEIHIITDRLPIRVECLGDNGKHREFYKTFQE